MLVYREHRRNSGAWTAADHAGFATLCRSNADLRAVATLIRLSVTVTGLCFDHGALCLAAFSAGFSVRFGSLEPVLLAWYPWQHAMCRNVVYALLAKSGLPLAAAPHTGRVSDRRPRMTPRQLSSSGKILPFRRNILQATRTSRLRLASRSGTVAQCLVLRPVLLLAVCTSDTSQHNVTDTRNATRAHLCCSTEPSGSDCDHAGIERGQSTTDNTGTSATDLQCSSLRVGPSVAPQPLQMRPQQPWRWQ